MATQNEIIKVPVKLNAANILITFAGEIKW